MGENPVKEQNLALFQRGFLIVWGDARRGALPEIEHHASPQTNDHRANPPGEKPQPLGGQ